MIKNFTLLLFLFASFSLSAQNINIPDANLKKALVDNTDINTNGDGEISESEAEAFTGRINISRKRIADLSGIEHFNNITVLWCDNNLLTSLDLSRNTKLTDIYCNNNQLPNIDLSNNPLLIELKCNHNQIEKIDVSKNVNLNKLDCYNNQINNLNLDHNISLVDLQCSNNQIETIDISNNISLAIFYCAGNKLTNLDISKNNNLTNLSCYSNQIRNINLDNNTYLSTLDCHNNQIPSLDISTNTALTYIDCSSNKIKDLQISQNRALIQLNCDDNDISSLEINNNKSLTELNCTGNQINFLDVSHAISLTRLYCGNNKLHSIKLGDNWLSTLSCNNNRFPFSSLYSMKQRFPKLEYFSGDKILSPINEEVNFELDYSEEIEIGDIATTITWYEVNTGMVSNEYVIETNQLGIFRFLKAGTYYCDMTNSSFQNLQLRTENIIINGTEEIVNIPDQNFKQILLQNSQLNTNGDAEISINEAKTFNGNIWVSERGIKDLTGIESFINLTALTCSNNEITDIDVSNNTKLTILDCGNNQISYIDISLNNKLIEFQCYNTSLEQLDLSKNTQLKFINCINTKIKKLDTSNNQALQKLFCSDNNLENLDISHNTNLDFLICNNTLISELNLTKNKRLTKLYCFDTKLENLDLTENVNLTRLDCYNNAIKSLDIRNNTWLINLYCQNNELSKLDLSKNTNLFDLKCNNNLFSFSSLKNIKDYYNELEYSSNKLIFPSQEKTLDLKIDFSSELNFDGNKTLFKWFDKNNNELDQNIIKEINSGTFKFLKTGSYYCEMSNDYFNSTILKTNIIKITKGEQFITFVDSPTTAKVNNVIDLNATASSDLEVSFKIISGNASLDGNSVTFNEVGTVIIKAIQEGNDEYAATEKSIEIQVDIATGIENVSESKLQIYPNPVVSEMVIKFESNEERTIRIFDLQGRLKLQKEAVSSTERLNLSDFKSGMYLMRVQSADESFTYKIIKK